MRKLYTLLAIGVLASALAGCEPGSPSVSMDLARSYDGAERACKKPHWLECDGVTTPSEVAGGS